MDEVARVEMQMKATATFSKHLRELMEENGLSCRSMAAACGATDATIDRYLNGIHGPRFDNLIAIVNYFGVSVDWMIGTKEERS